MKKLALAAIALGFSVGVNAACKDVGSIKGDYPLTAQYTGYKNGYVVSCGAIGIMRFDGKGGAIMIGETACGGAFTNKGEYKKITGSYTFDQACSGSAIFSQGTIDEVDVMYIFDKSLTKANGLFSSAQWLSGTGYLFKQ